MRRAWRAALGTALLLAALGSPAYAQACREELGQLFSQEELERAPTGVDAAVLLRAAVELVEPAMPALQQPKSVPLEATDPGFSAVKYLLERKLLPGSWEPDALDGATWADMLDRFLAWYRLPASGASAPTTVSDLIADASRTLTQVGRAVRPAALLATDPHDDRRASFWGIIWNWTVYPRLLVVRPDDSVSARPADVMAALSNCAVRVTAYVAAPEETAKSLFLTHNTSRMYVVASLPNKNGFWPYQVPAGEELDAFAFRLDDLSGTRLYAAVFDGPQVGIGTLLALLWRVRTNVPPTGLMNYLFTPN